LRAGELRERRELRELGELREKKNGSLSSEAIRLGVALGG